MGKAAAKRLGELLIAAEVLTHDQLDQALRAQVMWGGRIGTNLIELGFVGMDDLSRALSTQHHMPAVLAKHFDRVDRELQQLLSPDVAERFLVVPLARFGAERQIVLAATGPLPPRALAIIADELCVDPAALLPSIAPELRVRYHLERVYGIPRETRFLRSRGKTVPPFPTFEVEPPVEPSEVDIVPLPDPEPEPAPPPEDDLEIPAEAVIAHAAAPERAVPQSVELELDDARDDDGAPRRDSVIIYEVPVDQTADVTVPTARRRETTETDPVEDLDDLSAEVDDDVGDAHAEPIDDARGRERRRYVPTLGDADAVPIDPHAGEPSAAHVHAPVPVEPEAPAPRRAARAGTEPGASNLGRMALRKVAMSTGAIPIDVSDPPSAPTGLQDATRAIRRATGRDRMVELVMTALERFAPELGAALFLVVRNEVAVGWKAFARVGDVISDLGVPIDRGGLVPTVMKQRTSARRPAAELDDLDRKLLTALGVLEGDLVVVPITIAGQVMCLLAGVLPADAGIDVLEAVAAAAAAGFARLMRDASR